MAGDVDFNKVSLLLHFDGANGSTAFTDNSPVPKTVTAYGNANISTTQSKWGGSSLAISGGSDYLSTPSSSSFDFAAQDFCVELYVRFSAVSGTQVLVTNRSPTINDPGFYLRLNAGVIQGLCWGPTAGTQFGTITGTTAITTAKWYHVAYCRSGGAFRLFVDGVLQGSVTSSDAIANSTYPLVVGKDPATSGREFFGHIDDLRITKGAARYTTNFTPPTEEFPNTGAAYALSGTVTGSTGSPVARAIRAQREDTGAYVGGVISNATTGAYTIPTSHPGEHTVVAYPVTGEGLPALVHHGVIPV